VLPVGVVTDRAATYPVVLEELLPAPWHRTDQYANNRVEADHGRLKPRLRPMRGLKQDRSASVIIGGLAFVQNVGRGQYELAAEELANRRLAVAFDELAWRSELEVASRPHHAPGRRNATAPLIADDRPEMDAAAEVPQNSGHPPRRPAGSQWATPVRSGATSHDDVRREDHGQRCAKAERLRPPSA
jgi:DDE domain